jgi:glyoxylase-like metal-dependent hydrolase (beta-lactamase superfamily II)
LNAGGIWLDGGAMFGVVAKPLWEKHLQPDSRNRIRLALRCLLVEHEAGAVLIDTGVGNKENEKFVDIYGVENEGSGGRTLLEDAIAEAGLAPEDVKYVINTHLHFDHAGGNTFVPRQEREEGTGGLSAQGGEGDGPLSARPPVRLSAQGGEGDGAPSALLSFPNATYVVQRGELESAQNPNERTTASYLRYNFQPITEVDRWHLVNGEAEIVPGISVLPTPGHTPFHQSVLISDGEDTACFLGDCIPTTVHIPIPWIMAYDLEPLVTVSTKKQVLTRAESEGWVVVFEHDPIVAVGKIGRDSQTFVCHPLDTPLG